MYLLLRPLASLWRGQGRGSDRFRPYQSHASSSDCRLPCVPRARNGATVNVLDALDRVTSTSTPPPASGQASQTTSTSYDLRGFAWKIVQPDGTSVTNEYYPTGLLKKTSGSRTYPVEYSYDSQARLKTMKTWTNFSSGSGLATTTWNYDAYRGFLLNKRFNDNSGPDYAYTPAGRLWTRRWARGIWLTNAYNNAGDLWTQTYSDGTTATVQQNYDRRGRLSSVIRNGITTALTYNDLDQVTREGFSGGTLGGFSVRRSFDAYGRAAGVEFWQDPSSGWIGRYYNYDTAGRLNRVSGGSFSVGYSYVALSGLIGEIAHTNSGMLKLTTTRQYDRLNRLQAVTSSGTSGTLSWNYTYNDAHQRVRTTLADGSYWLYLYDALGQVVSGKRYWNDNTPVAGQQFEYGADDIGNRTSASRGGDATGAGLRSVGYSANSLNQMVWWAGVTGIDILGVANPAATVTVNGSTAYRKGDYFHRTVTLPISSAPVLSTLPVSAVNGGSSSNMTPSLTALSYQVAVTYDLDGNMTSDSGWTYTWDGENRLAAMEIVASAPSSAKRRVEFEYDWQGRRIGKKSYTHNGSGYVLQTQAKFFYDGWNLLMELDGSNAQQRSYVWGLDLSGSLHGAGGVGGLLMVVPSSATAQFVASDGNGNVAGLVDTTSGAFTTWYEYGPFGEPIRANGLLAKGNPFRWSSKFTDDESDLVYYGHRYYNPHTGRWPNRDPIGEKGGVNMYGFVANSPVNARDLLGLLSCGKCGADVTDALDATLAEIEREWEKAPRWQQFSACDSLFSMKNEAFRSGWFIPKVASAGSTNNASKGSWLFDKPAQPGSPQGALGSCARTLAYRGGCYEASDLHYMMFGKVMRLCNQLSPLTHNEATAVAAVWGWKTVVNPESQFFRGAAAMTEVGYWGQSFNYPIPFVKGCTVDPNNKVVERSFEWQWKGLRELY